MNSIYRGHQFFLFIEVEGGHETECTSPTCSTICFVLLPRPKNVNSPALISSYPLLPQLYGLICCKFRQGRVSATRMSTAREGSVFIKRFDQASSKAHELSQIAFDMEAVVSERLPGNESVLINNLKSVGEANMSLRRGI